MSSSNQPSTSEAQIAEAMTTAHQVSFPVDALKKPRKFWGTQPVLKLDETPVEVGPIDREKTVDEIRKEPLPLPAPYEWLEIDVTDEAQIQQVYDLLANNYVEDDDEMFRFAYPIEFLKWALTPPHFRKDWHIAVVAGNPKKLYGFISAVPATMRVKDKQVPMVEINFLCVHKRLRNKSLAPVLIKEITRRVNLTNVWQAVYTAGVLLPRPVAKCQYWHRSLNPAKLCAVRFSRIPPRFESFSNPMQMTERFYKVPDKPQIPGVRAMQRKDVSEVRTLLSNYLSRFDIAPVFTSNDELAHWLLPRPGVIDSFVVEDPQTKKITDFISFYILPSTIIGNDRYKVLTAAYSFYNVPGAHSLIQVMNDALILAKQRDVDVFNCLDLMENGQFLEQLKFGIGDGALHYYLYNYSCPDVTPSKLGLVML